MPLPKPALSDAALRAWGRDARRHEIADLKVPGLIVRGEPSGNPTFHVRKRIAGKRVRVTLGAYPAMSLKAARAAAIDALSALNAGRNPATEKREAQQQAMVERAEPDTVRARWRAWLDVKDRTWTARYADEIGRLGELYVLPALGVRVLRATIRQDWTGIITAKGKTHAGQAAVLYRVIASFHGYCEAMGWLDHPLLPRRREHIAPEPKPRERVLSDAELIAVWRAAEQLAPRQRALVRLLILLGARVNEIAGMCRSELDPAGTAWTLPGARSKNKRPYTLPLGRLALPEVEELLAAPRVVGVNHLKAKLDEASGVTAWRLHDLRRTCRSNLARLGVLREIAERCLNHVKDHGGIVGIYDRHNYSGEIAVAMLRWHDHVAAIVGESLAAEPPGSRAEVIELRA